jgi:streptomycin 6-kinase
MTPPAAFVEPHPPDFIQNIRVAFGEESQRWLERLHRDFHHFNILLSGRGWLVIAPKGVIGPAEYETGPLLMNPYNVIPEESWAICQRVLSSFWDMAEDGSGGESARAWTEIFIKSSV